MGSAWAIARLGSAAWGQRGWSCWPGRAPGQRWKVPVATLLALWAAAASAWAQQRVQPLPAQVAQLSKPNPRPASPPPATDPQTTAPANPANSSSTHGCSLSIDQMQQVARGQVLRLGQGDCQMRFNTVR
jgi:hypothetical protein